MNDTITIEDFNRMTGQETLHPLVTMVRKTPQEFLNAVCGFYALIYKPLQSSLSLYCPGDIVSITADFNEGVLFHPDLLCGSHLEHDISRYPVRCRCKALQGYERRVIVDCLNDIDNELHHSIDRFSSLIIVSHIGLLLDYCVRFCDNELRSNQIKN